MLVPLRRRRHRRGHAHRAPAGLRRASSGPGRPTSTRRSARRRTRATSACATATAGRLRHLPEGPRARDPASPDRGRRRPTRGPARGILRDGAGLGLRDLPGRGDHASASPATTTAPATSTCARASSTTARTRSTSTWCSPRERVGGEPARMRLVASWPWPSPSLAGPAAAAPKPLFAPWIDGTTAVRAADPDPALRPRHLCHPPVGEDQLRGAVPLPAVRQGPRPAARHRRRRPEDPADRGRRHRPVAGRASPDLDPAGGRPLPQPRRPPAWATPSSRTGRTPSSSAGPRRRWPPSSRSPTGRSDIVDVRPGRPRARRDPDARPPPVAHHDLRRTDPLAALRRHALSGAALHPRRRLRRLPRQHRPRGRLHPRPTASATSWAPTSR